MRKKREVKDDEGWTGARVSYRGNRQSDAEVGTVLQMVSGKLPCVLVEFGDNTAPRIFYTKDLERLG